jgi:hypothetical protein
MPRRLLLHSPIKRRPPPLLNTPITRAFKPRHWRRPSPAFTAMVPSPGRIKGPPPPTRWNTPTPSACPLLLFVAPTSSPFQAEAPPPSRRLLTVVQAPVSGSPFVPPHPLRVATLAASRRGSEQSLGRALASHRRGPVCGPPWTEARRGPWPMDRVHGFFLTKIILKSIIPDSFVKRPMGFSKINPQSMISQLDP